MSLKDWRQKIRQSSIVRPMPFRKRVYCRRPKCFRWLFLRRVMCRLRMQSGKWDDRASIVEEFIGAPGRDVSESARVESGVEMFLERWFKIGARRSSSSRRGRARDVL